MLKKSKLVIASIFAMFAMALPACNSNTNPKEQHTHTYSEEWSKDATYHWHAATCEHTNEVKDKAEHTYTQQVIEPTYESGGYTVYTCTVCEYTYTGNETAKLEHHYSSEWHHDDNNHYHLCTDLGFETLKGDEAPHTFTDKVTEPTYDAPGYTTHTCSVCGYYYIDSPTAQLIHQYEEGWHKDENNHWHACIDSGFEHLKTGEAPHRFGEVQIDTPATEDSEGVGHKVCEVCGYSANVVVDKLDHKWGKPEYTWSSDYSACTAKVVCENDIHLTHVITETVNSTYSVITKAECEKDGSGRYSAHFTNEHFTDQVFDVTLDAFGHDWGDPSYTWSSDYSTCTAKRVCAHDKSHIETETVNSVIETVTPATLYEDGVGQYAAEFTNTAFNKQTHGPIVIDATGTSEKLKFTIDPYYGYCAVSAASTSIRGEVVIPSKYNGVPVSRIAYEGFKGCGYITSIALPSTIENIEQDSFSRCYRLTEIINHSSISLTAGSSSYGNIAYYAKQVISDPANSRLSVDENGNVTYNDGTDIWGIGFIGEGTEAVVPNNATKLSSYAFTEDTRVTSVVIPNSITEIAKGAFTGATSLETLTVPFVGGSKTENTYFRYIFGGEQYNSQPDTNVPASLKTVILSSGCTTIAREAFRDCKYLETVILPDTLTSIGVFAFDDCTSLKTMSIPNSVTTIEDSAFKGCSALEHLSIPFVGKSASATTGSKETTLGYIFGYNSYEGGLETSQYGYTYYIPASLRSVVVTGERTLYSESFARCENITSIDLIGNIDAIKSSAFLKCTGLTSLVIPDSVTSIATGILSGCTSLESLTLPFIGTSPTSTGTLKSLWGTASSVTVPTSLKEVIVTGKTIGDSTFNGCSSIETVVLSDSTTKIGDYAFYGCKSLKSIFIPKSVTSIGDKAFSECSNLETVIFEEGSNLKTLGSSVFYKCMALQSIELPYGLETIGSTVFEDCREITTITLPSTITSFASSYCMFRNCMKLTSINLPDCMTEIGYRAFDSCQSLTSIRVPEGVITIGDYAFSGCTGATSINIPSGVTAIGLQAFAYCSSLTNVSISSGVKLIKNETFKGCAKLESVSFAENCQVTSIGDSAFNSCTSLASFTIPDSVTSIGQQAFLGCSGLKSLSIGSGLTSISKQAFRNCRALETVTFSENSHLTTIGISAFSNCSALQSISIPDSVTTIEESAFERCTSLASITLGNGLVTIGDYAFLSCPFETISIPASVTSIGSGAFYFCSSLASIYFDGTVDQFNALGSASNFFSQALATFVRCSNGNVNIA